MFKTVQKKSYIYIFPINVLILVCFGGWVGSFQNSVIGIHICLCFPELASKSFSAFKRKMLTKVNPNVQNLSKMSRTSYFVRFLLKICFFPLYIKEDKIIFRLFSFKTIIHVTLSFGVFITVVVLAFLSSEFTKAAMSMLLSVSIKSII